MKNILEFFKVNKDTDLLNYLIKPTKTTEYIMRKDNKFKIVIILNLLILYGLISVWNIYFWISWQLFDILHYFKIFIYNIFSSIIFTLVIWYIWLLFKWMAKYIDLLLITMLSLMVIILFNISYIITLLSWVWFLTIALFILIPVVIWFLVIWSKWLSRIENFSESKVTYVVVISIFIIYFLNWFLSKLLGI